MQTTAEATQAITSSVRRNCSICLFLIKNQIIINLNSDLGSLVALYVVNRGFGKGHDFGGGSESKIDSLWELYLHQAGAL